MIIQEVDFILLVSVILLKLLLHLCVNCAKEILNLIILAALQMRIDMIASDFITGWFFCHVFWKFLAV